MLRKLALFLESSIMSLRFLSAVVYLALWGQPNCEKLLMLAPWLISLFRVELSLLWNTLNISEFRRVVQRCRNCLRLRGITSRDQENL